MDIPYPDYNNCIANLACSVLAHFGAEAPNPTLAMADKLLRRGAKNVVILLLDGMGMSIAEGSLAPDGFFRRNLIGAYSSVFPTTTVAATTSVNSGLYPDQHGWLGWDCYYPQIDENVTVFSNTVQGTKEQAASYNAANTFCPYESVAERLGRAGVPAYYATPFEYPCPQDLDGICRRVETLCALPDEKYIYAYWSEPDHSMHQHGTSSPKVSALLTDIEKRVEELAERLSDTLLIITADHGQIDSELRFLPDYPDIEDCLVRMPSIEPRALNLFCRPGRGGDLQAAFAEHFGEKFRMFAREEVLDRGLFGPSRGRPEFAGMLGDYLAVALGDVTIFNDRRELIGVHAGLTDDELRIPLIAVST